MKGGERGGRVREAAGCINRPVLHPSAGSRPLPLALKEQRIWGNRERHFARVLPRLGEAALADLLQSAHQVDGIVKGLKRADWPLDGWQALQRLALQLCALCDAGTPQTAPRGKIPA